jgi:hypothetical protein
MPCNRNISLYVTSSVWLCSCLLLCPLILTRDLSRPPLIHRQSSHVTRQLRQSCSLLTCATLLSKPSIRGKFFYAPVYDQARPGQGGVYKACNEQICNYADPLDAVASVSFFADQSADNQCGGDWFGLPLDSSLWPTMADVNNGIYSITFTPFVTETDCQFLELRNTFSITFEILDASDSQTLLHLRSSASTYFLVYFSSFSMNVVFELTGGGASYSVESTANSVVLNEVATFTFRIIHNYRIIDIHKNGNLDMQTAQVHSQVRNLTSCPRSSRVLGT